MSVIETRRCDRCQQIIQDHARWAKVKILLLSYTQQNTVRPDELPMQDLCGDCYDQYADWVGMP
jgi:hypothetical protein